MPDDTKIKVIIREPIPEGSGEAVLKTMLELFYEPLLEQEPEPSRGGLSEAPPPEPD